MKEKLASLFSNPIFEKHKTLILPIASLVICLLLLILIIIPHFLSLTQTNNLIGQNQQKYDVLTTKLNALKQINKNSFQDDLQTTLIAIPTEKEIPSAMGQVLFLLGSSKLQLQDVSFSSNPNDSKTSSDNVDSYQIRVSVRGDSASLKDFIAKLKKVPRVMKVVKLGFSGNAGAVIDISLSLATYFQSIPTALGKVDQPLTTLSEQDLSLLSQIKTFQNNVPASSSAQVSGPKGKTDPFQ